MHDFYTRYFADKKGVTLFKEPNADFFSNHWLTSIIIDPTIVGKTREELRLFLEQHNIETRPLWKPMHLQPVFAEFPYYGGNVAESLFENGLCLPSGSNLTAIERERLAIAMDEFFL